MKVSFVFGAVASVKPQLSVADHDTLISAEEILDIRALQCVFYAVAEDRVIARYQSGLA